MSIKAKGRTFEFTIFEKNKTKLLEKSAQELFSLIFDMRKIHAMDEYNIELTAESFESIALEFLQELLEIVEVNAVTFRDFNVKLEREGSGYHLYAKLHGEPINFHHRLKKQVFMLLPNIKYKHNTLIFCVE